MSGKIDPVISRNVLSTLVYHSIFGYPLTIEELHRLFMSDQPIVLKELKQVVKDLIKQERIYYRDKLLCLKPLSQISGRQEHVFASRSKEIIARRAAHIIGKVPWVKMVAITGALAMNNVDEHDDIDLMIVTAKNRLWIVRPMVMCLVSLLFKRRKSNLSNVQNSPHLANALCFNLWLDEASLEISNSQRNLYIAHELAQMKPIVNEDDSYEKIMALNGWGERYLANAWQRFKELKGKSLKGQKAGKFTENKHIAFHPFNFLNLLFFSLQLRYMRSKMTNERVSVHSAFFHPGNRADTILTAYDRIRHRYF